MMIAFNLPVVHFESSKTNARVQKHVLFDNRLKIGEKIGLQIEKLETAAVEDGYKSSEKFSLTTSQ